MAEEDIQSWIRRMKNSGTSDIQIRQELVKSGWRNADIRKLLGRHVFDRPAPEREEEGVPEYTPRIYSVGRHILKRTWQMFLNHWTTLLFLGILFLAASYAVFSLPVSVPAVVRNVVVSIGIAVLAFVLYAQTAIIAWPGSSLSQHVSLAMRYLPKAIYTNVLAVLVCLGGMAFLILPGLFMFIAFITLPYVVMHEGKYGFQALSRCYALARNFRGNMIANLSRPFLINIALFVVFFVVLIIVLLILRLFGYIDVMGQSLLSLAVRFSPYALAISFPIFLLTASKAIYDDLASIRPVGSDLFIERRGLMLARVYVFAGLAIGFLFLLLPLTKEPATNSVYL